MEYPCPILPLSLPAMLTVDLHTLLAISCTCHLFKIDSLAGNRLHMPAFGLFDITVLAHQSMIRTPDGVPISTTSAP